MTAAATPALDLRDVTVRFRTAAGTRTVLHDVSLRIGRGESYGLVGESGCGKSTTALAIVRYLARNGRVDGGSIHIAGQDVLALDKHALARMRAGDVSMVYQEPGRALNPAMRVGDQIAETFTVGGATPAEADERTRDMLRQVQIADPDRVLRAYPHMLSGGMKQRVVIAMALASRPGLLILDEPTTALDATVGAEVLDLVAALRAELGTAVLFISHNLSLVANLCDRVGVLYAGRLIEEGPARDVLRAPRHPYTVGLLRCIPRAHHRKDGRRLDTIPGSVGEIGEAATGCVFAPRCPLADERCVREAPPRTELAGRAVHCFHHDRADAIAHDVVTPLDVRPAGAAVDEGPVVTVTHASKTFRQDGAAVRALDDVSLTLSPGETLGLVGESGSGKTTLGRMLIGLEPPDDESTELRFGGEPLPTRTERREREAQRGLQMIFQNPDTALNRRHRIARILGRAVAKLTGARGVARQTRVHELVRSVNLDERYLASRPARLSGGLKQRVAIAHAFAGRPRVVVCDEPTSALDVSVQARILNLLADLQRDERVAYLFVSHDLAVVGYLADRIMVLYLGQVMEVGPTEAVLHGPHHPYTEALVSAVPELDGVPVQRIRIEGELPSPNDPPAGCAFHTRCHRSLGGLCATTRPPLVEVAPGHEMRCHIPLDELRRLQRVRGAVSQSPNGAAAPDAPTADGPRRASPPAG